MNRKDLLTAGGIGLVLTFGWYQFVWQSQGKSATTAAAEATAAKEAVTKLSTQISGLERTKTELETKAELAGRIEQAIPPAPELSSLVKQLQATAKSRNVELTTINTGQLAASSVTTVPAGAADAAAPAAAAGASEMTLTLSLHGTYPAVVQFVSDLGQIPRLVVVDSVALSRNDTPQADGAVSATAISATITAKVFSTATPAGPDGAVPTTTAPATAGATTTAGGL
jgi:Tfp pilus assembly protein PilO